MLQVVTAQLGAEGVRVAGHVAQHLPEHDLTHSAPVKGGGVDEVHAEVDRDTAGLEGLVDTDAAKFLPQRGCPVGNHREFEIGFSEFASFHFKFRKKF